MNHYSQDKLFVSMMKNPPRPQKFQKHQKIHIYAITKDAVDERDLHKMKQRIAQCVKRAIMM